MIACIDRRFLVIFLFHSVIFYKYGSTELDAELLEGKQRFDDFTTKITTYGSCWKSAFLALEEGCRHLTDEIHSRLAIDFANCFLKNSGSKTCDCPRESSVADCLKEADDRIFSTYRDFYTHTRSICYFLQHQVWQENTRDTIKVLSGNSEKVSRQLEKSSKSQQAILHLQQVSLDKQQQLISRSESGLQILNTELERSRLSAKEVFEEFKSATDEQRSMIFVVFDHIKKLERLVLGEFTGFYTYVYYLLAIIVCYVLTSAYQTSSCRIWLYGICTVNFIAERVIIFQSMDEESAQKVLLSVEGPIYYRIWLCRKVFGVVCLSLLGWTWYTYKDYDRMNNRLLLQIQQEQVEMKCVMQSIRSSQDTRDVKTNGIKDVHDFSEGVDVTDIEKNGIKDVVISPVEKPKARLIRKSRQPSIPVTTDETDSGIFPVTSPGHRYNLRSSRSSTPVAVSPTIIQTTGPLSQENISKTIHMMNEVSKETAKLVKDLHRTQRCKKPSSPM